MPNASMVHPLQLFLFARLSLEHLNIDLHMFMHILALHRKMVDMFAMNYNSQEH